MALRSLERRRLNWSPMARCASCGYSAVNLNPRVGHVSGESVRVVQSKTGVALTIPVHRELREVLNDSPRTNLTFLMTNLGEPFTAAGFGNWFRDACDSAGLQRRSAHGLRKAAARRLAEAGCSALQIAAVTGHKTLK
jgi:integrase